MTNDEIRELFASNDLIGIGFRADVVRKQLHAEQIVSYALDSAGDLEADSGYTAVLELAPGMRLEGRLHQIMQLREEQAATGRFLSFALKAFTNEVTASEYMKMLAISRICLDNIPHAQVSVAALDTKLAQVALRFGANDLGVISLEQNGARGQVTEEQTRRLIRDAGFTPKQRDQSFRTYFLY